MYQEMMRQGMALKWRYRQMALYLDKMRALRMEMMMMNGEEMAPKWG